MKLGAGLAWADTKTWWANLPRWKKWLYGSLAAAVPVTGIVVIAAASGGDAGASEPGDEDGDGDDRVYLRDELGRFAG